MAAESQQIPVTNLARTHSTRCRTPSMLAVDWSILLEYNPPPGYRAANRAESRITTDKGQNGVAVPDEDVDQDDKVCVILRNILHELEKDVKDEKKRLKAKRREKRMEQRLRRENRLQDDMEADNNVSRRHFRVVSSVPGFSKSLTDDRMRKRMFELEALKSSGGLSLANMRTRSLDRKFVRECRGRGVGSGWSRYARDSDDIDVSLDSNTCNVWDERSSDFSENGTDSDATIENETSDTESVDKCLDAESPTHRNEGLGKASSVAKLEEGNVRTTIYQSLGTNTKVCSNLGQSSSDYENDIPDIKFRKQFSNFEVLPSLKRSVAKESSFVDSTVDKYQKCILHNRSNSVDQGVKLFKFGTKHCNSDDTFKINMGDSYKTGPFQTSFEDGAESKTEMFGTAKAAPIPKPPRKRPHAQKKCLIRQKPVKNIETLLLYTEENTNDVGSDHQNISNGVTKSCDVTMNRSKSDNEHICEGSSDGVVERFRISDKEQEASFGMDSDRSLSIGTSGYSTDECSVKTSDSEDEAKETWPRLDRTLTRKLDRYFLVLKNGSGMALQVDNSNMPNQESIDQSSVPLRKNVSMSDLAIPDHLGWLTDMSRQQKVWGVVVDMLFCIFEDQDSSKPVEAILLPGCNVRPLVYNTAKNGLQTSQPEKTISGISKFQLVIDNVSTRKKYLFGLESQAKLDAWYNVLKKASVLDSDLTNDISTNGHRNSPSPKARRLSLDGDVSMLGYKPSRDSPNRVQKIARASSPLSSPRDNLQAEVNGNSDGHPSPRGLVRHDSRRQSVKDFKKMLRREPEPEVSKQQPVKAQHFNQNTHEEKKEVPGKKLRSIGSLENLFKFARRKSKKDSECDSISNDDTGSIVSGSSAEQEMMSRSVDISATSSKLKKTKSKQLSRSLDSEKPKKGNNGIVRRASDIKDKVFPKRSSKTMTKFGELKDPSMHGFLHQKHHLKWQRLWCVVCRGCFYGFKSQSPDEVASVMVNLANSVVAYVTEKDKRQKRIYIFKLSQENKRSIYLCCGDYKELLRWLTVLQMESNTVIANAHKLVPASESETESFDSSLSSQNGSVTNANERTGERHESRSRAKKNRAPPKPPRHSSCPPSVSREPVLSDGGSISSGGDETGTSGTLSSSQSEDFSLQASVEDAPKHDKALTYVWQNDRGYLFNAIRAKLNAYKKKQGDIYNKELPGADNQGLLVVQDQGKKGSREIKKSHSFSTNLNTMNGSEIFKGPSSPESQGSPMGSPGSLRKRHKPLVVKRIGARDLETKQAIAGYMERKGLSTVWQKYWYILHDGTLFCYLTPDDTVTVDMLNLHGYSVTCLVDKFRGKRFVIQLSHENFTSLHLSLDSREEMDSWLEALESALKQPSSSFKEAEDDDDQSACAGCESNRREEVGEKSKLVKQKLLEEMLRQKRELERKQAERLKKQRNKDPESPDDSPLQQLPEFLSDEQRTSDVTRLRQRRLSTQLKVDTIQKQIIKPSGNKRGLFGFGKAKKLDENKNEFLQGQLKELNTKLHKIDSDLNLVEHDKVLDNFDVNQNRMTSGHSQEVTHAELDDNKGNGFKEKMQKWTNKTFSKSSTKRKQQQSANTKSPQNGSVPNLTARNNSDLNINGHSGTDNESELDNYVDDNLSLENSVTDLTRPTADLRLDLNSSYGSGSPSIKRYSRSNSRGSTGSTLSSPRKEIDPSVMAEIDAFEELTKQVLGARLKEQPDK